MTMDLMGNIILNSYSFLILILLYIQSAKHGEKNSLQHKLFTAVLLATAFLLLFDSLGRFDGNAHSYYPLFNRTGNFLMFLLFPVIPACWFLYVHFQVFHDERRTLRLLWPISAVGLMNAALAVLSLFFGWYYSIDAVNVYHRGPLFWCPATITVALLLFTYGMLTVYRRNMERKYYHTLIFFALPPLACIALQLLFYGISFMLNSVVFSLLIVYFNIQNGAMYVDNLTGVNNRKKLELHLQEKITVSTEKETFSAILIDLDNFKAINDTFGHAVGDEALEIAAKLLKSCIRRNDLVARFGGDEFYLILNISEESDLVATVERIQTSLVKYNEHSGKPYSLDFSMGYAIYDAGKHPKSHEFQKMIDDLMYENKRAKKAAACSAHANYPSEPQEI